MNPEGSDHPAHPGLVQKLGLGRLWYRLWYDGVVKSPITWGQWRMTAHARRLPTLRARDASAPPLACSFLTGHRFWYQSAFCGYSLAQHHPGPFQPTFFDDGTLRPAEAAELTRIFPAAQIVTAAAVRERLDRHLPRARFPLLRGLRDEIPMVRKLVDVRAGSRGWQLYLDSDMLFFGRPDRLLEWHARHLPFSMHDHLEGYCAPINRVDAICQRHVIPLVNAGVFAFDDRRLNWDEIESWARQFTSAERRHILFEQTLSAALLSGGDHAQLPRDDYRVLYASSSPPPSGVLLHYVYQAKPMYFTREWRRYQSSLASVSP